MNLWNKIVLGAKFVFGGFESATDYILKLVNDYLAKESVVDRVQKVRDFVLTAIKYLKKYEKYCPAIWAKDFKKLLDALQVLADAFEDNKLTPEEIAAAVAAVQSAIRDWMN